MKSTTMQKQTSELPTPEERDGAMVLIFDGHCKFCLANMRMLRVIDGKEIAYLSLHDPQVAERWPELKYDQLMDQIHLIDLDGNVYGGAAAFRCLSRKLMGLWPLAPLLHIPGSLPLWQFAYKQIAKIRYRFGRIDACDGGSCSVHFK